MLWWVTETTLVSAALAVVAALASRVKSLGPAARHALWLVVLVKLVTPPLLHTPWPAFSLSFSATETARAVAQDRTIVSRVHGLAPTRRIDLAARKPTVRRARSGFDASPPRLKVPQPFRSRLTTRLAGSSARFAPGRWVMLAWFAVSLTLAVVQGVRIARFRRKLRGALPASDAMLGELKDVADRLGVAVPEVWEVPGLSVPLLWCLGRPKLLLPSRLVQTLSVDRWRGVLAHELAHLRRGDPWVNRLCLVAGWFWWWNPVYWLACRHLDAEAELACDAWVVWTLPDDRLLYAETLFDICTKLSRSVSLDHTPSPALGVTGAGRFFERRLTMILSDQVSCRLSVPGLLAAGLLTLLALPSWTAASAPPDRPDAVKISLDTPVTPGGIAVAIVDDDDDDDDDHDGKKTTKSRTTRKAKPRHEKAEADDDDDDDDDDEGDDDDDDDRSNSRFEINLSDLEKAFGPNSDFARAMERLGPMLEKTIRKRFGPGSDFEKGIKEVGEAVNSELSRAFGPGSDFDKAVNRLGDQLGKRFSGKSEDEDEDDEKERKGGENARKHQDRKPTEKSEARALKKLERNEKKQGEKSEARALKKLNRNQQIKRLESKIDELMRELKRLKNDDDDEEDDEKEEGDDNQVRLTPQSPEKLFNFAIGAFY